MSKLDALNSFINGLVLDRASRDPLQRATGSHGQIPALVTRPEDDNTPMLGCRIAPGGRWRGAGFSGHILPAYLLTDGNGYPCMDVLPGGVESSDKMTLHGHLMIF